MLSDLIKFSDNNSIFITKSNNSIYIYSYNGNTILYHILDNNELLESLDKSYEIKNANQYESIESIISSTEKQLDEMQIRNSDLELQTNSMVYTTLFATALGTCVLYYFARQL